MNAMIDGAVAVGTYTDNVMVMANLGCTLFVFVADDLLAVLAELAVHGVIALEGLADPVDKTIDDALVVAQITGLDELNLRVGLGATSVQS